MVMVDSVDDQDVDPLLFLAAGQPGRSSCSADTSSV